MTEHILPHVLRALSPLQIRGAVDDLGENKPERTHPNHKHIRAQYRTHSTAVHNTFYRSVEKQALSPLPPRIPTTEHILEQYRTHSTAAYTLLYHLAESLMI